MKIKNLEGKRFGRLTVISFAGMRHYSIWNCVCDCGKRTTPAGYKLLNGDAKSCGCRAYEISKKLFTKHGMYNTRTYRIWESMKSRCSPSAKGKCKKYYFDRGIRVCRRWNKFENFFSDMGICPEGLEIDRADNYLGYSKANCRWVTRSQNQINKRPKAPIPE